MMETDYDASDWAEIAGRLDKMTAEQERVRMTELNNLLVMTAKDCVELFALMKGISAFEAAAVVCDAINSGELRCISTKH